MRYVAFLRGINVSGQKIIKMEELREHFKLPGFSNIASYIQSGNVLFDSKEASTETLRTKIEKALEKKLGYAVTVIVRSVEELQEIVDNCPFKETQLEGKAKVYITMLSAKPEANAIEKLKPYLSETELLEIKNREVYMVTDSFGNSKLSNAVLERKLGLSGTARNWNTMNKLLTM